MLHKNVFPAVLVLHFFTMTTSRITTRTSREFSWLKLVKNQIRNAAVITVFLSCIFSLWEFSKFTNILDSEHVQKLSTKPITNFSLTQPSKADDLLQQGTKPFKGAAALLHFGLSCLSHSGPPDEIAQQEMVYWEDIHSDLKYKSTLYDREDIKSPKYIIVENALGGFNNMRMRFEISLILAHVMNRTLVLMPDFPLKFTGKKTSDKSSFSFLDFYALNSLLRDSSALRIISMKTFLETEAMVGNLVHFQTGATIFPPSNQTDWNGSNETAIKPLINYLRSATTRLNWELWKCLAAFGQPKDINELMISMLNSTFFNSPIYEEHPLPVNATPIARLREHFVDRKKELCYYDMDLQRAPFIQWWSIGGYAGARPVHHFYNFVFFTSWEQDLFYKRFVRDRIRYTDEIQCAAARVVLAIKERARSRQPDANPAGDFDSFHIRRGDFLPKNRSSSDEIYQNCKDQIPDNSTVFIATDESQKSVFQPLANHFDVVYLDDFKHLLKGLNTNYYGMVDQLVASKGRAFFGTYGSTFSGYIIRLRGYRSSKEKLPGYQMGVMESWYHSPLTHKDAMRQFHTPRTYNINTADREFPTAWRNIDEGISELHENASK